MNIQEYIDSGILETYVLGGASDDEVRVLLQYKEKFPEVAQALHELEIDLERIASQMAILPPPGTWAKIDHQLNELAIIPEVEPVAFKEQHQNGKAQPNGNDFIHVESESSHMRIHKSWKWVFAAVFVLGKIFLGFAIYFYLENRQAQEQVQELKTELRQLKVR